MRHSSYSGELLARHLRAEQLSPRALAQHLGVDADRLEAIATQRPSIAPDLAGPVNRWLSRRAA